MESGNRVDVAEWTKVLTEQVLPVWKKLAEEISSVLIEVFKEFSRLIQDLDVEKLTELLQYKDGDDMSATRQAVLRVSRPLLEALLPDFRTVALLRYGELVKPRLGMFTDVAAQVAEIAAPFHSALKLPANCRITGISVGHLFDRDEVAFRIESPDFVETLDGGPLPEVQAVYQNKYSFTFVPETAPPDLLRYDSATGYFLMWDGLAVETRRIYGPDGEEVMERSIQSLPANPKAVIHTHSELANDPSTSELTQLFENTKQDFIRHGVKAARVAYAPGGLPCEGCGSLLLGRLTAERLCPDCTVKHPTEQPSRRAVQVVEQLGSGIVELLERHTELVPSLCWRCHSPTTRRLPDGAAECRECAEKPLL